MALAPVNASSKHRPLEKPLKIEKYRIIQQYLVDRGVNQRSARQVASDELSNWSLNEIDRVFSKVSSSNPNLSSLETGWLNSFSDIVANSTTSELYWTKAPAELVERSAKEGLALCINKDGYFDLREKGYFCISHVWEEGIRADADQNRGVPTHRIKQIFERVSRVNAEWIWLDGLAIPCGNRSLTFKEEVQKSAVINSLAEIYEKCEAVLIFDALTMHLRSNDPIETAIILICGKWMTRVWTWQEIKITRKALVLTATSTVNFDDMVETLRVQAGVGPGPRYQRGPRNTMAHQKYYEIFMAIARLSRNDILGTSLPDIAMASYSRRTENDIDYARAYFPLLGLKWRTGMSREEAMQVIYDSQRRHATRLVLMHGSPRTSFLPGWAPSYLKGLEGVVLAPIPYETRGIRRRWHTTKIKQRLPTGTPQGLFLALESYTDQPPLCGCLVSEGESQATMDGITKAIEAGNAYLLSDVPLHPIVEWAKHAILVERVELDHADEAYVFLTVAVTVIQENAITWEGEWLIRHESPISKQLLSGKGISELRVAGDWGRSQGEHRIINAAYDGDEATVNSLMSDPSEISDRDEKGWTALHAAGVSGNLNVARILLRDPPKFNPNAVDNFGRTPLYLAVQNGNDDLVNFLIDSGADPNCQEGLKSILDQAITSEGPSTVQLLLAKGADPNKVNGIGQTPIFVACSHPDMLRILLSYGADPFYVTDHGMTALTFAARSGNVNAITQLLDQGMDPNTPETGSRRNPLYMVIENQEEDAVSLLLCRGADPNVVYSDGWTPLMLACKKGHSKICQALVEAGAKTGGQQKCSPEGWTALHVAAMCGHRVITKLLVENGADLDARDSSGSTALKLAIHHMKESTVQVLKSAGAKSL
ncbi:MAG: hypothetical protein Q9163_004761 [Psora crenata]